MPKNEDINKILIIGSGPVVVGQAGELDQASAQACDALRTLGYQLIIAHSDPAAVITDAPERDQIYIEPLDVNFLTRIIAAEKPHGLLATLGGQTALNLAAELVEKGILQKYNVQLLGLSSEALNLAVDRRRLKEMPLPDGIDHASCRYAGSTTEAVSLAEQLHYPIIIRSTRSEPGSGNIIVYNVEELQAAVKARLANPRHPQIIMEESLIGYQEIEIIAARDSSGGTAIWSTLENLDPVGIHHGDSVATIPAQSITAPVRQRMEQATSAVLDNLALRGIAAIRFAYQPQSDNIILLNVILRASRSTSLAGLATALPIHQAAALLACDLTLAEIGWLPPETSAPLRIAPKHTVVKFPVWSFDSFDEVPDHLDIHLQAVGEVAGLGKNFKTALQKALRSLPNNNGTAAPASPWEMPTDCRHSDSSAYRSSQRYFHLFAALKKNADVAELSRVAGIHPVFLKHFKELAEIEQAVMDHHGNHLGDDLLARAKSNGFSDDHLAACLGSSPKAIRDRCKAMKDFSKWLPFPINFSAQTVAAKTGEHKQASYLMVGPGPGRLGHGLGFDHSNIQAIKALKDEGFHVICVNCNPASATTRNDALESIYLEPLALEDVAAIYQKEAAQSIIIQFSGPQNFALAPRLCEAGMRIAGLDLETIEILNNHGHFRHLINELGMAQPRFETVQDYSQLAEATAKIGYPVVIRPKNRNFDLNGDCVTIVMDDPIIPQENMPADQTQFSGPLLVERFLEYAIECEVDALCDGNEVLIPTVLEHVELAGVHSADSACVTPPYSTSLRHVDTIHEYTLKIAKKLKIRGILNIRFAILNDTVYVLEATPWATPSLPLSSKICNIPMAYAATRILLGKTIAEMNLTAPRLPYFAIREAVFPFASFPQVDPLLGPRVYSTGSVLALDDSFGLAYFKSQEAILLPLPLSGSVLITVTDADKPSVLEPARLFKEMGFSIKATKGTQLFLENNGIPADTVRKLGFGRPNLVDAIKNGEVDLVINTPSGKQSQIDDADIRKAAIQCGVPNITTPAGALAAAKGISARLKGLPKVNALADYYARLK